jgi:magnesium chelatase family protein
VCGEAVVRRYLARLSGPLLDRVDLHLEVPAVPWRDLAVGRGGEPSAAIRERVARARAVQQERFAGRAGVHANAHMAPRDLRACCRLSDGADAVLRTAIQRLHLSARAYHRTLKIARTIADLAGAAAIAPEHVSEAIQYRTLDRGGRGTGLA